MKKILPIIITVLCTQSVNATVPIPRNSSIQHRVKINDHTFSVYEKRSDNPRNAIVLIHGRTISALPNFDLQLSSENVSLMDAFVAEGFSVYAIDLRGFGETRRDESDWNTPQKAAKDVGRFLNWVAARHPKDSKLSLFGYSLGALHSQLVAQNNPKILSELILFGYPITYISNKVNEVVSRGKEHAKPPRKPNTVEWSADGFMTDHTAKTTIDAYVAACLKYDPILVDWRDIGDWNQLDPLKLTVPTLLINGVYDPYAPADQLSAFFSGIKSTDKSWIIIPESGHNLHVENGAARLVASVVNFIRRNQVN